MGMALPTMLISYYQYKEYDMDKKISELRKKNEEEEGNKKYGCKYIWETRCQSFVKKFHILSGNMSVEKQ